MQFLTRVQAKSRKAGWWTMTSANPRLLAALAVTNIVIGLGGVTALAVHTDGPVSVGDLPAITAQRIATRAPQPAPIAIAIPSIGVQSALEGLDVGASGELAVPKNVAMAGWWSAGPRPGADGAAVVVGHVDSTRGPAVFYRLRSIAVGATIVVTREDNSVATFVVDAVRQYAKDTLPTSTVYGPTASPALRLITCGGSFDAKTRSYRDNVVVFAHLETDKNVEL